MSVMAGPDLNVTVDANVTGYERKVEQVERSTERWRRQLENLESDLMSLERELDNTTNQGLLKQEEALRRHQDALDETGRGLALFGAATVAAFGLAANEAVQWESAWAGVTKTVDGSAAEMALLEDQLRELATTLPATHEEIAAVAEAAGQLGVARQDVSAFAKTMIDLAETTDLTADDAATSIAQMMNVMQTAPEDVGRMGAALVALGNDGASTESQILGMAQRIAGAGAQIGLTEGELLAIANALASVGIEVEAGGSAISSVMKKIDLDVSTNAARLEDWARVADMSTEDFRAMWEDDAAGALNAFVTGLGQLEATGGDAIKVLADMEIKGIRESDALLRMAGSGDLLTESIELGNRAWEENSALLEEAAKRYDTTESKLQVARNQLRDAGIDIGTVLLPAIAAVAGTVSDLIRAWQDLPGPIRSSMVVIGLLVGSLALLGGGLMMARTRLAQFVATTATLEAGGLRTMRTGLAGAAGFMMGPWGLAIGAGITALGIFAAKHGQAAQQVDALKATLDAQTGAITDNSREWAVKELSDNGVLEAAKNLGLNLATVTEAALGNADAMREVSAAYAENSEVTLAMAANGDIAADSMGVKQARATEILQKHLGDTNETLTEARSQWELESEAMGRSTESTEAAAAAQEGTTAAWGEGADAAGELTEEVKTLGEQLTELSEAYLSERAAGRAVRDGLREIRTAVRDYRKEHDGLQGAFADGTKSGDEFAGMLDDLASDYLTQIETTEALTGSQRKTMQVYRESRDSLIAVAQTLGMTEKEAKEYANQILGTPKLARTVFDAQTGEATADVRELQRLIDEAARNRQARIDITVSYSGGNVPRGLQEANGGIVETFADGGFSSSGEYVQRVPQLRQGGGTVVWNEPETSWEAYISGKPSMRERNRGVWADAGRRLGFLDGGGGGTTTIVREIERLPREFTVQSDIGPLVLRAVDGRLDDHSSHADARGLTNYGEVDDVG